MEVSKIHEKYKNGVFFLYRPMCYVRKCVMGCLSRLFFYNILLFPIGDEWFA